MKQKDIKSLSREYLSGLKISCNDILYSKEIPNEEINDYLQKSVKCICDKLSRNEEIAAELDTIKSIDRRISEDDEIVLFVTDTIDGSLSARILMDSIRIFWNSSVRCQIIEGLSVEKNDNQIQEGCIQLLRKVVHEVKDDPENTSVVITGGYKFMIAYMNLGALLYGAEVIYIYEGSKKPIYLPKVNLMPNLSIWNEYFDIFHELERNGKLEKSDYRNVINMSRHNQGKIHSDMNPFIEKIDGKKYITLNPIGEVLHKRAFEMYKDNLTGLFDRSFFDLALKPWMSRIDPKQCGI
ncbi:MAG: putative CRISPR-associated protein, partial [Deltaproteobacteria bacterium]